MDNENEIAGVVARYFTCYKIKRSHDNNTKIFIVNVPEVKEYGIGLQIKVKQYVYGFSIHSKQQNNG
jgi:hypothetical protein